MGPNPLNSTLTGMLKDGAPGGGRGGDVVVLAALNGDDTSALVGLRESLIALTQQECLALTRLCL